MTTTLTLTSGQSSFTAQGYTILPSPGTPVPDSLVQAIISAAGVSGVVLSSSAGTGVVSVPSRRFTRSGTGPPQAGEGRWLLGDEIVDSTGAQFECTAPGDPGTWFAQSGTTVPTAGSFTYDGQGNPLTDPDGFTYTWNADGTPHTQTKGGVTRTFNWNTDGTLASVS